MSQNYNNGSSEPVHGREPPSQHEMTTKHSSPKSDVDDWEEWEDDDVITLIDVGEPKPTVNAKPSSTNLKPADANINNSPTDSWTSSPIETGYSPTDSCADVSPIDTNIRSGLQAPPPTPASVQTRSNKHASSRASRRSVGRINRLTSKKRQKAQNAKLGIKLITDMTKFRRQNHIVSQMRSPAVRAPKFVDAAALRALEGSPNEESVGNWNWLKKGKGHNQDATSPRSPAQDLSPEDRPIVIGITLPSDEVASRGIDPLTATVNTIHTPIGVKNTQMIPPIPSVAQSNPFSDANQPKSVWSPDTPDTACSFGTIRRTSSVYSQATMPGIGLGVSNTEVPPVPALPANYKKATHQRLISLELGRNTDDDDDSGTPCTLFEEDGNTPMKSPMGKLSARTPDSAGSRAFGWWDHHVVTPFLDKRMSFSSRKQKMESRIEDKGPQLGNRGERAFVASPKENMEHMPWTAATTKIYVTAPTEKMEQQATRTMRAEGDSVPIYLPTQEKEQHPSTYSNTGESKMNEAKELGPVYGKEDGNVQPNNAAGMNGNGILITLATDVLGQLAKGGNIKQGSTHPAPLKDEREEQKWILAEGSPAHMSNSRAGVAAHMASPSKVMSQQSKEGQHIASPKPSWPQVQAPVIRVPTPRQTPPPRSNIQALDAPRTTPERSVLALAEPNTQEQHQAVVIDRVQMNSTPTLRIPTPRRTPSPLMNATETPYEPPSQGVLQEKHQTWTMDDIPADHPPPYSPPKKQVGASVRYQAVFPPDHHLNRSLQSTVTSGLASTGSSQGTGRRNEDVIVTSPANASTSREMPQTEPTARSVNGAPMPNRPGAMFVSIQDLEETPTASQSVRANNLGGKSQAAVPSGSTRGPDVSRQQSRFSLSPTSSTGSCLSGEDTRVAQRHATDIYLAQPVGLHPSEHRRTPARLHKDPEKAYPSSEGRSGPVNWSGGAALPGEYGHTVPLPTRPVGTYLPQEHAHSAPGPAHKVERERRRHEKEEVIARRVGGFWRGRGCIPKRGCFGRAGREGRKKRRIWMGIITALIALIILAVVLAILLTRHHGAQEVHSIWVNLTDFPPMPTGVLTVVGPDNTVARSGCTAPSTLWSCSLPKDSQNSVAPYKPNQPTVIFQIQWDNSTSKSWDVPNGTPPTPISRRAVSSRSDNSDTIQARDSSIDGFNSSPSPPSFTEMWFLGETTDGIQSNEKAGEPAPFFISMLKSVNDTVGFPSLSRRDNTASINLTKALPEPDLQSDGTPQPAMMLPNPVQQPVRLYDRGLPTEHYGFYTYFKRTIFLKSVTVVNQTSQGNVPLDEDGGCSKTEANFLVTWAQTRMHVQIWTRQLGQNSSSLLTPNANGGINNSTELIRPGTMPYPVTVTLDTHGGDRTQKFVWEWPMNDRQKLAVDEARLLANNMAAGGTWINPRDTGDAKFGGFDGGSGGCKCQWVNWV